MIPKEYIVSNIHINQIINLIEAQIQSLIELARNSPPLSKPSVSNWSNYEHLEHLLRAGKTTLPLIESCVDNQIKPSINELAEKLFNKGFFPRGASQAPSFTHPNNMAPKKLLKGFERYALQFNTLKDQISELLKAPGSMEHPLLGHLSPLHWITFMAMHQDHHIEIILDIQKQ